MDYSRPASGFRFKSGSMKVNSPADAVGTDKYPYLQNVREAEDSAWQTRPGLAQLFATNANPVTDIRAYTALSTDSLPRLLARTSDGNIWLDNGTNLGPLGASPDGRLGVSMIPFRPAESPNPYMYIANGLAYQKYSAPSASNAVTVSNVGIAEPQTPPQPVVSANQVSFMGPPSGQVYVEGGNASGIAGGNRLTDKVQGLFPDPLPGIVPTTIQVTAGSSLAAGVYLLSAVQAYFFDKASSPQGAYRDVFPVNTGAATASASGNSLMFNPPQFNGTTDPNAHPVNWAVLTGASITSYTHPYPADAGQSYYIVLVAQLYVPVAGNYTININHDDGMIFAIAGTSLISGAVNDPFTHTKTAVNGYQFTNGTIAGTNGQGYHAETFVINFPVAGTYSMEIDYAQFKDNQALNVYNNGAFIVAAGAANEYQKTMRIVIDAKIYQVLDVFPPLPSGMGISGIYYYSGTTGRCVVVPASLGQSPGTQGQSLFDQVYLASIRRGALLQIGSEVCYVLGTAIGPDGTISFETSTVGAHTTADQIFGVPAIQVGGAVAASVGDAITSPDTTFSVTAGISTATLQLANQPFINSSVSFQNEDYLHLSVNVDNLSSIEEIKLLIDVGDGTFTQNFYYYTIRPSDIEAGVQNALTQLGVAQLADQRATIDEERTSIDPGKVNRAGKPIKQPGITLAGNQGVTYSSAQTSPGNNQWSEILFQISELTRVGNDQTRSLQSARAVQLLVNANGSANIAFNGVLVYGGFAPDVGAAGAPYQYRVRPRSTITGVRGNPSPVARFSVSPRRQQVTVWITISTVQDDPQFDTWDIFRYGGTVTSWRFIGTVPAPRSNGLISFIDNYGDDTADAGEALEFDNYEPWPTIDLPLNVVSTTPTIGQANVIGHIATITVLTAANTGPNILRYLPGNQIKIGNSGNVYTLWTRPTFVSHDATNNTDTYLMQLVENAGVSALTSLFIYEPQMAKQPLPYMWGPDANGTVFAVGDPLRLGSFSFCKGNAPDAAPDRYNQELTPPSEPLLGGDIVDGLSYVGSSERWWALYPTNNEAQRYDARQQPVPRGLVAPYGKTSDGRDLYFWAKDGIWSTGKGSLTDADLYNLFPHEGVAGVAVTYNGRTVQPPDYSRAGTFRLAKVNNYLYATYQDATGTYRQLTLNVMTMAWRVDSYADPVSTVYRPEQPEGTLLTAGGALYPTCVMGTVSGKVAKQQDNTNDLGLSIACVVNTVEWDGGDFRAGKQWGDAMVDVLPATFTQVAVRAISNGAPVGDNILLGPSTTREDALVSVGGGILERFLGLEFAWSDNYASQSQPTKLYGWQPSFIPKQETTADRFSDWMEVQPNGRAGFVQGLLLHADTFNAAKSIQVRDSDTLSLHTITPTVIQDGESTRPYSFTVPFVAHMVRIEPQDQVAWRMFSVHWIAEPTPEQAETWITQPTAFELNGYSHIQRAMIAYSATAPVTLTVTSQDGTSPAPIVLPSTAGVYVKTLVVFTANKGLLYTFKGQSTAPFQLWLNDFELMVGNWGRTGSYLNYKSLGGVRGDAVKI